MAKTADYLAPSGAGGGALETVKEKLREVVKGED